MKIKCPFCKNENIQSEIDSSIDEKGNIFFTCYHCTKESIDTEWEAILDLTIDKPKEIKRKSATYLTLCKTADGMVHFCDESGIKTFCEETDFEIISIFDVKNYTMCDECMNQVSKTFGIPIEAMRVILGLDDAND
jgi:hypothetical protein